MAVFTYICSSDGQRLVSDRHPVQAFARLVNDVRVLILKESIAFTKASVRVFDEVERTELSIALQQLLDMILSQVIRDTTDEDFVWSVWYLRRHDAQQRSVKRGLCKIRSTHVSCGMLSEQSSLEKSSQK